MRSRLRIQCTKTADVKKHRGCSFSIVFACVGCYLEGVNWLAEYQVIRQCFRTRMKRCRGISGLCSCRQQRKVQLMQSPSIKHLMHHNMQHSTSHATFTHTTIISRFTNSADSIMTINISRLGKHRYYSAAKLRIITDKWLVSTIDI